MNDESNKLGYILAKLESHEKEVGKQAIEVKEGREEMLQRIKMLEEKLDEFSDKMDKKLNDLTFAYRVGRWILYILGAIVFFKFKEAWELYKEFFRGGS